MVVSWMSNETGMVYTEALTDDSPFPRDALEQEGVVVDYGNVQDRD
jgi:hypothetical protein